MVTEGAFQCRKGRAPKNVVCLDNVSGSMGQMHKGHGS